ncbi:ParB/RepB/Spo0J family partition protein [Sodalis endosymbiont of Spalangia cameroni]|uniref:ParB/RepB/Spo0J family partition protein n=1 Tax=Sodalis praecaptivus TaxID=1239307 RepID=UPI0031F73523
MSRTESTLTPATSKAVDIENMLATAAVESVALSQLIPSGLNVRRREPDADKISELARSIAVVGVLQNLVVIPDKGGKWAVVAGSRRLLALRQLQAYGQVSDDFTVPVKKVSAELGGLVSLTENTQREAMHPSEQLAVFRTLSESGKSAAEIAGLLGYTTRHVQKLLKLARVHTELLNALARDEINVDQLQALASCDDTEWQWQVWLQGEHLYDGREPRQLRNRVLNDEVCADDNAMLAFVGMAAYTSAGGEVRHDLFTDAGYLLHPSLLDALVIEKVANLALHLADNEGWSWSEGRLQSVKRWGEDSERYRLLPAPEVCDEEATGALEDALDAVYQEIESCEDRGEETSDTLRLLWEKQESIEGLLRERRSAVQMRAWSEEAKAGAGVVVSFDNGAIKVQRGIMRTDDDVSADTRTVDNHASNAAENAVAIDNASQCTMYSAALLRSLTAERTLAVQAALAKNPDVALVFLVHTLLLQFFGKKRSDIFRVNVENKRTELLTHIVGQAETRKAIIALTECENEVIQCLPI